MGDAGQVIKHLDERKNLAGFDNVAEIHLKRLEHLVLLEERTDSQKTKKLIKDVTLAAERTTPRGGRGGSA